MPAGIGRTILTTVINIVVVLVIVSVIISAIFVTQADMYLRGLAQEMYQAKVKALEPRLRGLSAEEREEILQRINESIWRDLGLLRPLHERVMIYAVNAMTFRFENFTAKKIYPGSYRNAKDVVFNALRATIILFTTATIIELSIAIFLGLQAAKRAGSLFDRAISGLALVSASLPMWWVGLLMLLVFSYWLGWFPFASKDVYIELAALNRMDIDPIQRFFMSIPIWLKYLALPLITVVLVSFGGGSYIVRNIVVGTIREDFVMVARAKGLPERSVLYKHVLRAASPPIVTMSALSLVGSLGGAIITETVFQWPGMGLTYWIAINNGDVGVLMANTYLVVFLFIVVIFTLDFIYMMLDPRVRVKGRKG